MIKSKTCTKTASRLLKTSLKWLRFPGGYIWHGGWIRKTFMVLLSLLLLFVGTSYGVAEWYIHNHDSQPLVLGTTFIPDYAESFGLDPHQTLNAILGDLKMKQVRLVSYWSEVEP